MFESVNAADEAFMVEQERLREEFPPSDSRPLHRIAVLVEAREDHDDPPWTDEDLFEAVQATLHEVFPLDYDKGGSSMTPVVPVVRLLHEADQLGRPPQDGGKRWRAFFEAID